MKKFEIHSWRMTENEDFVYILLEKKRSGED
jgi:hypothetical protein